MNVQLAQAAAVLVAAGACVSDLRTRRIPNTLTFGSALLGAVWFLTTAGFNGLLFSLAGWAVGLAVFLPLFLLRGMGAGDVKLLAALGAWLGASVVLTSALYAAIAGGVLAVGVAVYHGYLKQAFKNLGGALMYWLQTGPRPVPALTLDDARGPRLAYALPILIGMVTALWLR